MYIHFLFVVLFSCTVMAQFPVNNISIEHLSLEQGLSQSTVTSICQDSEGFMWFGTANGLNRYDGYSFKVFKSNIRSKGSISNDIINCIYEDSSGTLWIATENGLNRYNKSTGTFRSYLVAPHSSAAEHSRLMPVVDGGDDLLWTGSFGGGLILLNKKDGNYKIYKNDPAFKDNSRDFIWCAVKDKAGNILLGSYGGLIRFNTSEKNFFNFPVGIENKGTSGRRIYSIYREENEYWIGSNSEYLDYYDASTGEFRYFKLELTGKNTPGSIYRIVKYDNQRFLLGTMGGGILIFNKNTGAVESSIPYLTDQNIYSLFKDKTGIIWGGTYVSGLNKIIPEGKKFRHYKVTNPENSSPAFVNCLYKDETGIVWLGTTQGLSKYGSISGKYSLIRYDKVAGGVMSICGAGDDNLWLGSSSGLYKFNKSSGKVSSFSNTAGISTTINALKNHKDKLVICTRGEGIKILNRSSGIPERSLFSADVLSGTSINAAVFDREGRLWAGGSEGLYIISEGGQISAFPYNYADRMRLSSNNILSLCIDRKGILWAGTYGGGLNRIDSSGAVKWFSEPEGLPNNVIYGILEDDYGNLWLSTNKGICMFNTSDFSIKIFDKSDGLQGLEFNGGAYHKSEDGEMFFGGLDGWNSFYPSRIKDNPYPPGMVITGFSVFSEKVNSEKPAILSYYQNFISFDFAALEYHNPMKHKYAYMLEGFDKDWIFCGSRRFASYTNLPPGEYVFRVKGSNNDNVWDETGAAVAFLIAPPFWQTWWFYLSSLALLIVLTVSVHKYRIKLKMRQLQKLEEIRKRIADDFHDELGHKLTRISLYSEIMKKELSGRLNGYEQYLQKINSSANELYDDTKDFIWSIDPGKDTLFDLAVYLKDFGDEFFDKSDISFIVTEIPENFKSIVLPMNWKRQIILMFKESMNNILKHSLASEVKMDITISGEVLRISLTDNGKGIPADDINKSGRGISIMKSRAEKIGGSFEVLALPDGGSLMLFNGVINPLKMNKPS